MAEYLKYTDIGSLEVTFKTAASTNFTKITSSHIGKPCAMSANETVAIPTTIPRPIKGKVIAVQGDYVTVQTGGYMELPCGETITLGSTATTPYFSTVSQQIFNEVASVTTAYGGNYANATLIKSGSTSVDAIVKLF